MKKLKIFGIITFILALLALPISFILACTIGEADIFGVGGIVRYSWIMLLSIPFAILSILMGILLKKASGRNVKNFVAGCIVLPLGLIFGSFRVLFAHVNKYDQKELIQALSEYAGIELSLDFKSASTEWDVCRESFVKLLGDNKEIVETQIKENPNWVKELRPEVKGILPPVEQTELTRYDYCLFLDKTNGRYNDIPDAGRIECVLFAYNRNFGSFLIVDSYFITL